MQAKYRNFVYFRLLFLSKFGGTVFVSSSYDSINLSHVIAESSKARAKYFPSSQLHVEGFQT